MSQLAVWTRPGPSASVYFRTRRGSYTGGVPADVAQLVERNLAKVEVESSRLFCRSSFRSSGQQSGQDTAGHRSCSSVAEHSLGKGEVGSSCLLYTSCNDDSMACFQLRRESSCRELFLHMVHLAMNHVNYFSYSETNDACAIIPPSTFRREIPHERHRQPGKP